MRLLMAASTLGMNALVAVSKGMRAVKLCSNKTSSSQLGCWLKPWLHVQFIACNALQLLHAIIAGFVFENIHEAKLLQPMTAFGGIT